MISPDPKNILRIRRFLGGICNSQRNENPCSALFIWDSNGTENIDIKGKPYKRNNYSKRDRRPEFAFTASRLLQRDF
ncbi:putative sulfate permease C3H7.02 [Fusarium oxysporum f. sp. albedinis]|nr:Free methionine-R-sulfoxide reductase [Fusarium oxysporum f. sp. albedinis]KAJ0139974.1 putative sulfate permease C3H7.02 [Fusarium oxysporum f. sp. albedinis]